MTSITRPLLYASLLGASLIFAGGGEADKAEPTKAAAPADPDGITIRRGSPEFATIANSPALNQIELTSTVPLGVINAGDILLISDCAFTEAMTVQVVAGNQLTATGNLSRQFRPGSQVMRLETVAYTVVAGELRRNGQAVAAGSARLVW